MPLPVDQWGDEAKEVLPRYLRRPELYLSGKPDAPPMPQALGLFAHHVDLGAVWMTFTQFLAGERSTLDPALRELAILRVAWRTGSVYEWKQHTRIALGAGLTNAQLHALPDGPVAALWTPLERVVLEAVDQIIDTSRVEDATWRAPGFVTRTTAAAGADLRDRRVPVLRRRRQQRRARARPPHRAGRRAGAPRSLTRPTTSTWTVAPPPRRWRA